MALNMELQQRQTEQEKLLAQRDDVSSQLQEVNRANSRLLEQVTELGQEKDKLQQELEETRKTADKRQAMLDERAIDVGAGEVASKAVSLRDQTVLASNVCVTRVQFPEIRSFRGLSLDPHLRKLTRVCRADPPALPRSHC
ncbi:hypothetical protein AAFF_G00371370 [Aldrovandia affinis]|uniref:Uncharacterized protein n=1 Tax=Aldrovandia affinis TaxID=143900 RepID=A0AAD7SGV7_9TELE|nr:hypothetical protein AAFF_G00371370 [Aldrovandia affinis]